MGVLTNLESWQFETGKKFTNKPISNPEAFDVKGIFDLTDEEYTEFLNQNLTDYSQNYPAREDASKVIKKIREEGNKIVIVTGRFHTTEDTPEGEKQRNIVLNWLKEYDIEYDKIVFTGPNDNKIDILKKNNVILMIEDKASTIETLSKHMTVICFDAVYNRNCCGDNIYRVQSWWDIYNCIKNF